MTKEELKEYHKAYYQANKEKNKAYREANRDKIAEKKKAYYQANKEKLKEKRKGYYEANRDKITEYCKAYYEANRDKLLENNKAYRKENRDKLAEYNKEYHKAYYEDNREHYIEYQKEYNKKKRKIDPLFKLKSNLRNASWKAFKGQAKNATTQKLLGCTYNYFKDYIESQFVGNMTWENYGDIWHVDHIIPLATIKNVNQIELIESLCHFSNLQPLFAEDNLSKKDKLDYEYPAIYKTNLLHNSNKK
jgi:hypothetical protein